MSLFVEVSKRAVPHISNLTTRNEEEHLTPNSEYAETLSSAHDALLEVTDLLREAASLTPKGRTEFDLNGWSVMTEQAGYYTRRLLGNVGRLEVER